MVNFADRLSAAISARDSRVCVGLDPRVELLPSQLATRAEEGNDAAADACREFCCEIIRGITDHAVAVKPQAAFFELLGPAGYAALWRVIAEAKRRDLLVILDVKRGDIGSTAEAYARAYFQPGPGLAAPDAITVNPYLGEDGIKPFVDAARNSGGGLYVLTKTSNPSSGQLQDLTVGTDEGQRTVYEHIGRLVDEWGRELRGDCGYSSVGAVIGATYPAQLAQLRHALPSVPFLVPGYGAQGGGAGDVAGAFDTDGMGAIVNSARGIIFAYRSESGGDERRYAQAAARAAKRMKEAINRALEAA